MEQERITLKNIKYAAFASQETHCYEATIYFDGKKVGHVSNEGHGGCDDDRATDDKGWAEMLAFIKTLPREPWGFDAPKDWSTEKKADHLLGMETDLEIICCDLVGDHLVARDLRRDMKKSLIYIENGEAYSSGFKGVRKLEQKHIDWFKNKYPNRMLLNCLAFDEAFKVYKNAFA